MTKETDKLLSTRKVAQRLGYEGDAGLHRVQRLIAAGKLPAENHSVWSKRPNWRVRESVLKRYVAERGYAVSMGAPTNTVNPLGGPTLSTSRPVRKRTKRAARNRWSDPIDRSGVYVVLDETTGLIKIGLSVNVEERLSGIASEVKSKSLLMLSVVECRWREEAVAVESAMHWLFRANRVRGEWFRIDDRDRLIGFKTSTSVIDAFLRELAEETDLLPCDSARMNAHRSATEVLSRMFDKAEVGVIDA